MLEKRALRGSSEPALEFYRPHWKSISAGRTRERVCGLLGLLGPLMLDELLELLDETASASQRSPRPSDSLTEELALWVLLSLALAGASGQTKCAVCSATLGLLSCSGCHRTRYCSSAHQRQHWARHKADCSKNTSGSLASTSGSVVTGLLRLAIGRLNSLTSPKAAETAGMEDFVAAYAAEVSISGVPASEILTCLSVVVRWALCAAGRRRATRADDARCPPLTIGRLGPQRENPRDGGRKLSESNRCELHQLLALMISNFQRL